MENITEKGIFAPVSEEFVEAFTEAVKAELLNKGEFTFDVHNVEKVNNAGYTALTVTPVGSNTGVNLNVNFFNEYYEGDLARSAKEAARRVKNIPMIDIELMSSYEKVREKLMIEVISYEGNEEFLKNIPHKKFLDMAIVYRIVISSSEEEAATTLVTETMAKNLGVTPEQLHKDAMESAPKICPVQFFDILDLLPVEIPEEDREALAKESNKMIVATNPSRNKGAGVIVHPDFFEKASELFDGKSFFILPSSRHEVILVADDGTEEEASWFKEMVEEVNNTQVMPEDILTYSVYHYNSKEKTLEIA